MAAIQKLTAEIIGKIAAGEVVERPASVVKELVENAIDAEATHVMVELRGGGIEYIRITDNGKGIPAEQIRLAFERHATSKLQAAEQLFDVHTLGFRGEALASVAAVAKVSCTTKTASAVFGVRCAVEGGEFTDIRQAASPVGTTFIVEDLFYNTPVRRKFLKKPAMEAAAVSDYMLRLILSHPEIAFRFVSQGKTVYHSMGDGKLDSALFSLYGKEALSQMIAVDGHMNGVMLHGYVGVGENARGNRQQQSFFVNGRFFRNGALSRGLEGGCEGRVMIGKFPMCALFLEMPYASVDVNVHPNKLEVRFQDEAAVAEAVRVIVSEAMHSERLSQRLAATPNQRPSAPTAGHDGFTVVSLNPTVMEEAAVAAAAQPSAPAEANDPVIEYSHQPMQASAPEPAPEKSYTRDEIASLKPIVLRPANANPPVMNAASSPVEVARVMINANHPSVMEDTRAARAKIEAATPKNEVVKNADVSAVSPSPSLSRSDAPSSVPIPVPEPEQTALLPEAAMTDAAPRFVGIVFDTYWIFEVNDRLLLVDQHAAHERILYDRLMKRFDDAQISQRLLSPQLVRLNPQDMALAEEMHDGLMAAGFEVEPFDDCNVSIHGVPTLFGNNAEPKSLFLETLDQLSAGRGMPTKEQLRRQVTQMACKHAIKGGDKLNAGEVNGFLKEILKSDVMPTCPHGRPIVIEITRYALEKRFKRIQ